MLCTYQLMAPRGKLLPIRCPKCDKKYGGGQYQIFDNRFHTFDRYRERAKVGRNRFRVVLRIFHYSPTSTSHKERHAKGRYADKVSVFNIDNKMVLDIPISEIFEHNKGRTHVTVPLRYDLVNKKKLVIGDYAIGIKH
jgi:hypothetical protein